MNKFNKRMIISVMLLVSSTMLVVSALSTHLNHRTEVLAQTDELMIFTTYGSKMSHSWLHIHVLFGIIFIVACIFHAVLNRRTLKYYLIGKNK